MKTLLFMFLLLQIGCVKQNTQEEFKLQKGDFLFQDLDSSPLCDAIELVTTGYKGSKLSHVGMIIQLENSYCIDQEYNDQIRVLEALPNKVTTTNLDSFLNRSFNNGDPKVIVGRLKSKYRHTIKNAISFAKSKLGMNYDDFFILGNERYYCSELIYEAFIKDSIFELQPMNFLHLDNGDTLQTWKDYYLELGMEIPHNKLGINPGAISLSDKIEIVYIYGMPDGMVR